MVWVPLAITSLLPSSCFGVRVPGTSFFWVGTPFPVVFAGAISPGLTLGFSQLQQVEFRRCSSSVGRTSVSPVPVVFASAF